MVFWTDSCQLHPLGPWPPGATLPAGLLLLPRGAQPAVGLRQRGAVQRVGLGDAQAQPRPSPVGLGCGAMRNRKHSLEFEWRNADDIMKSYYIMFRGFYVVLWQENQHMFELLDLKARFAGAVSKKSKHQSTKKIPAFVLSRPCPAGFYCQGT